MNTKHLICIACAVAALLGWMFRWEITPINSNSGLGHAYLMNRWTGTIYHLEYDEKTEVKTVK